MDNVIVTLSKEEAESFVAWRQHQATFDVLLAHNVFDVRTGSVELHFNAAGQITAIDAHVKLYRPPVIHTTVVTSKVD